MALSAKQLTDLPLRQGIRSRLLLELAGNPNAARDPASETTAVGLADALTDRVKFPAETLAKLDLFTFDWKPVGTADAGTLTAFDATGKPVGAWSQCASSRFGMARLQPALNTGLIIDQLQHQKGL